MEQPLYLVHHGIKGMKWGVRRFQNKDGSLTSAGERRYGVSGSPMRGASTGGLTNPRSKSMERYVKRNGINGNSDTPTYKPVSKSIVAKQGKQTPALSDKAKRNLKIGLGVAAAAVVTYSAYKVGKNYTNAKKLMQLEIDRKKYGEMFDAGREGMMRGAELMDRADKLRLNKAAGADSAINMAKRYREGAEDLMREGFHGRARTVSEMGRILGSESNLDTSIREFFEKQLGY